MDRSSGRFRKGYAYQYKVLTFYYRPVCHTAFILWQILRHNNVISLLSFAILFPLHHLPSPLLPLSLFSSLPPHFEHITLMQVSAFSENFCFFSVTLELFICMPICFQSNTYYFLIFHTLCLISLSLSLPNKLALA